MTKAHPDYEDCRDCFVYGQRRMEVLIPALHERRIQTGETAQQILDRFMTGVHSRHLSGLPILPEERSA